MVKDETRTTAPGEPFVHDIDCPTGKRAVGGGWNVPTTSPAQIDVTGSYPKLDGIGEATGWRVAGATEGGSGAGELQVYAACVTAT